MRLFRNDKQTQRKSKLQQREAWPAEDAQLILHPSGSWMHEIFFFVGAMPDFLET